MPPHDAYPRITPFELAFPDREAAEETFREIEEEVEAREADAGDPDRFVLLAAVGRALRRVRAPGEDPERIRDHGLLLYHAYHAWKAGTPVHLLTTHVVRYLVETAPPEEAEGEVEEASGEETPGTAGYLQLPQHLVWMRPGGEATPESVDGVAWVREPEHLRLLVTTGIRGDRSGFGVVPLPPAPRAERYRWLHETAREDGEEFESRMPGGELEGLYEVRTAGEVLKLTARALEYLARREASQEGAGTAEGEGVRDETGRGRGPAPSALPAVRVPLE
jgi:hypothetical protein